ncbi:hypothetical protein CFN78_17770 [Amycolatopsis antarctica]|uniref:PucR C-terminal helix-turn-helix domain-containing protein n=1 Tax=Amycolatopsis antarctica TaxID=1854586 RepID=A0A263D0K8_9PSEU|nr:helix-turn-helix domain-containing protein [Amycolatopsis antarctica]OZM71984.1 hypothetical protein CFN78_17770 [Amycolatopsis antarctica]
MPDIEIAELTRELGHRAPSIAAEAYQLAEARLATLPRMPVSLRRDLAEVVVIGTERHLELAATTEGFDEEDVDYFRDVCRRAAAYGLPVHEFLALCDSCHAFVAATLWDGADPDSFPVVGVVLDRVTENHAQLLTDGARVYLSAVADDGAGVGGALVQAALDGQLTPLLAGGAGISLPSGGFLVAAVPEGNAGADEVRPPRPGRGGTVDDPLWRSGDGELCVLAPRRGQDDTRAEAAAWDRVARLLKRAGAELPAVAVPCASLDEVPAAARTARELSALARTASLPERLYGPDALLVDQCVARSPEVSSGLRTLLGTLREGAGLIDTLRVLYRMDLHRGRTARTLGVHRQTLNYRLRRIAELTGFHPVSARGIALFAAALAADVAAGRDVAA